MMKIETDKTGANVGHFIQVIKKWPNREICEQHELEEHAKRKTSNE